MNNVSAIFLVLSIIGCCSTVYHWARAEFYKGRYNKANTKKKELFHILLKNKDKIDDQIKEE